MHRPMRKPDIDILEEFDDTGESRGIVARDLRIQPVNDEVILLTDNASPSDSSRNDTRHSLIYEL